MSGRRYKKGGKARRGKRSQKKSAKPSKSFAKKVQAVIHKDVETKSAVTLFPFTNFNSGIGVAGDIMQTIPNISQGITDSSRIGDQIRAMKLRIKGHLIMAQNYNTLNSARIGVRLMLVQPKAYASLDAIQAGFGTWMSTLLKKGSASTQFTGIVSDLYADINREQITVYYDKVIYMTLPYIQTATGTTSVNTAVTQDLRSTVRFFNIKKSLRNKLLKYDSAYNSALTPVNYSPVLLCGYVHLDGSSPDTVDTQVGVQFDSYLDYEDA